MLRFSVQIKGLALDWRINSSLIIRRPLITITVYILVIFAIYLITAVEIIVATDF